jgi:hypothetical protein
MYIYIYIYIHICQYIGGVPTGESILPSEELPLGSVHSPAGIPHWGVCNPQWRVPTGEGTLRGESPLGSVHYQVGSPTGECTLPCGDSPVGSVHSPVPSGESTFEIVHSPVVSPHWGVDNALWGFPIGEDRGSFHWECTLPKGEPPPGSVSYCCQAINRGRAITRVCLPHAGVMTEIPHMGDIPQT